MAFFEGFLGFGPGLVVEVAAYGAKQTSGAGGVPRADTAQSIRDRILSQTGEAGEARANQLREAIESQDTSDPTFGKLVAALLEAAPAPQLTREPVPIPVSVPPTPEPMPALTTPTSSPQPTREPVPVETKEDEPVAFSINDLTSVLTDIGGLVGSARNLTTVIGTPTQTSPVAQASFLPQVAGSAAGTLAASGLMSFFGGGNGTALQRIASDFGKRVSRRQVITAARVCGLDAAANTFNTDVRNVCEVVSRGMPRRGRGISARDLRRTRSTLRKINTMRKSMSALCRR